MMDKKKGKIQIVPSQKVYSIKISECLKYF